MDHKKSNQLTVVTLNCWGLPLISESKPQRFQAIGETLAKMSPDIVGLQEVYIKGDRSMLTDQLRTGGLEHSIYFPSGVFGSGLFIISRYPIIDKGFWKFSIQGNPNDLIRPDYYSGKGLAWVRIQTPLVLLDFYNTHLIAPYLEIGENVYFSHRVAQAYETALLINKNSNNIPAILAGDLNSPPSDLAYRSLCQYGMLSDSFKMANPDVPGYTITTEIPYILVHEPERADYILFRNSDSLGFKISTSTLKFNEVPPEYNDKILAFSDHYGVSTTFLLETSGDFSQMDTEFLASTEEVKQALLNGVEQSMENKNRNSTRSIISLLLAGVLGVTSKIKNISRRGFLTIIAFLFMSFLVIYSSLAIFSSTNSRSEADNFKEFLETLK